jgi:hypothetical protein
MQEISRKEYAKQCIEACAGQDLNVVKEAGAMYEVINKFLYSQINKFLYSQNKKTDKDCLRIMEEINNRIAPTKFDYNPIEKIKSLLK